MPGYVPSASDRRVLAAIAALTEQHGGRPPTVGEVAVALGYQPSSRSNIQRQLVNMRPTYVTWASGARSIRVTAEGLALLETPLPQAREHEPVSDDILRLLASGLTWLTRQRAEDRPLRAPYRDVWQRGMNRLALACLERGVSGVPGDTQAVVQLCHRPLRLWPVRFPLADRYPDEVLLDADQPSAFCRELAIETGDAELELSEEMMVRVLRACQQRRAEDAYAVFREFLITHSVIPMEELLAISFDARIDPLGPELAEMYEPVPRTAVHADGRMFLCGFCGWTLVETQRGTLACGDERCRILTDGFSHGTESIPWGQNMLRVRRAIRRYIVAPGIYEVQAAQRLRALGAQVVLWPRYDAYDLRIIFPDGGVWAVDVKDWRYPTLLARHLEPLAHDGDLAWDLAFYAVPDQRVRERPNYLTVLDHASAAPGRTFVICTIDTLIQRARRRMAEATNAKVRVGASEGSLWDIAGTVDIEGCNDA